MGEEFVVDAGIAGEQLENWPLLWLVEQQRDQANPDYRHRLFIEDQDARDRVLPRLREYVQSAHEDARQRLRAIAGISLDPLGGQSGFDPAEGYPDILDDRTLKGYLGEVLSALLAEEFQPHEINWEVPAFLFRFHKSAFDKLELWRQNRRRPVAIPGRTGEDCLAFQRDENGIIIRALICEAKCTADYPRNLIKKAHEQLSTETLRPVDLANLIDILRERGDPTSQAWISELGRLWRELPIGFERCDYFCYVCGRRRVDGSTWIPVDEPHPNYTGGRRLEVSEVALAGVAHIIERVYRNGEGEGD